MAALRLVEALDVVEDGHAGLGVSPPAAAVEQIAVVKRAAAIMGVPYQTYLKQVGSQEAVADIEQAVLTGRN